MGRAVRVSIKKEIGQCGRGPGCKPKGHPFILPLLSGQGQKVIVQTLQPYPWLCNLILIPQSIPWDISWANMANTDSLREAELGPAMANRKTNAELTSFERGWKSTTR